MKFGKPRFYFIVVVTACCLFGAATAHGQEKNKTYKKSGEFCSDYSYGGDKVQVSEVRESNLAAGGVLTVDGERNGGIKVRGENRTDILIRACVRAAAPTEEAARAILQKVRVETGSIVRAESVQGDDGWSSVSYEVAVPRSQNLKLTTHNGGISISSVEGQIEFDANNGGIHLTDVAGDVRGKTRNGGLHVELSGAAWRGAGLNVETTNGGVHLNLPATYAARIEAGTTNGGFKSDIPALQVERTERYRPARLNTDFNGGGAPVRVITINGGVKISSTN